MSDLQITTKTRQVTLATYHWQCPGCGRKMDADREPGDAADALCPGCHQDWQIKEFEAHFAPVMGAQVTAIVKPREAFDELPAESLTASRTLWELNREIAFIDELDTVIKFRTERLLSRDTLVKVTYAHKVHVSYDGNGNPKHKSAAAEWLCSPPSCVSMPFSFHRARRSLACSSEAKQTTPR